MQITIDLPVDVHTYLLSCQAQMKINNATGQYSLQRTAVAILREHKELKEKNVDLETQLARFDGRKRL